MLLYVETNFRKINWTTLTASGNYCLCNPFLHKVSDLALDSMFFLPTHRLGNTLDLVFSNKAMIDQLAVFDPLISDHSIVIIELNILFLAVPENHELKIYQYSKVDLQKAESIFEPYEKEIGNGLTIIKTIYSVLLQGLRSALLKKNVYHLEYANFQTN